MTDKPLLNSRMADGSRHFASLPEKRSWRALRNHLGRLPGVTLGEFVTDNVIEAWIDFRYGGHEFTVNNQFGEYWFFVSDPACPESVLDRVREHCGRFLSSPVIGPVCYHGTKTSVLVGDHVEFKIGLFFWRGWQPGRVHYVPGISPKNDELEYNGLTWVAIHDARGGQSGHVVLPETNQLRKTVRYVRRADDRFTVTPANYHFGDEEPQDAVKPNT
jgi:hypothetical protein